MTGASAVSIGIREATDADLPAVIDIVNREIRESPFVWGEAPNTLEQRCDWLAKHRQANQPVVVAHDEGRPRARLGIAIELSAGERLSLHLRGECVRRTRGASPWHCAAIGRAAARIGARARIAGAGGRDRYGKCASIRLFESFGYVEVGRLDDIGRKFDQWRSEVFLLKRV